MKKIKKFLRKIAGKIVVYYYTRLYRKAVAEADARHDNGEGMIYVISDLVEGNTLSTVNRKEFRWIKHQAQKMHKSEVYWSYLYSVKLVKDGAWYHTADRDGNNGLSAKEIEVRRLAFIKSGLKKAKLL